MLSNVKFIHAYKKHLPGIVVVLGVTLSALYIQNTALFTGILPLSPLILAIFIGVAVNNIVMVPETARDGIRLCAKKVLRVAIIFLGFKLSFREVLTVGPAALVTITTASMLTMIFTVRAGKRLNIPFKRALLLGAGVSICGASAVAAVESVIRSDEEDAAFAIGAVTLLGTVFMLLYPVIYTTMHLSATGYALWAGASIHEVAQVAAAGSAIRDAGYEALASTVKMIRVLFIIPVTLALAFIPWGNPGESGDDPSSRGGRMTIPWFAILFFVMVIINSIGIIPRGLRTSLVSLDNLLMTAAMAGLGLELSLKGIIGIGRNAFILGIASSIFISGLSAAIIVFMAV